MIDVKKLNELITNVAVKSEFFGEARILEDDADGFSSMAAAIDAERAQIDLKIFILRAINAHRDAASRLDRAERALLRAGFKDHGGQDWEPPIGEAMPK